MKKCDIEQIFATWQRANPKPETELNFTNLYTLLVAVVLSAQATDVGVNKATEALFRVADTPSKMLALGEDGLKRYIRTIGLFNSKAKNIIALSRKLVEEYGSQVPADRDALQSLPGVGRKTANVVLNCGFGQTTLAVDTHVFRVSNRLGLVNTRTPDATEEALLKVIPPAYRMHAHHWLILHGRYICKARKPLCGQCPVSQWCQYKAKEL